MRPYLVVCAIGVALVLAAAERSGTAQPDRAGPTQVKADPTTELRSKGVSSCSGGGCHAQDRPKAEQKIRGDEYLLWNL